MAGLSGKTARIRYTSIVGTSSTDNAATITTGLGTAASSIQITATGRRHWDRSATAEPLLFLNSTLVPATAVDSINPVQGIFNLNESRTSTGTYTIDCHFLTTSYLTGGQSWTVDVSNDMLETTSFSTSATDPTWRTFLPGLSEASAGIDRLTSSGTTGPVFFDRLNLEVPVIVELVNTAADRFEGYGYIDGDSFNTSLDSLTEESVSIKIDGPLYHSTT
jgi:hypothetical protein